MASIGRLFVEPQFDVIRHVLLGIVCKANTLCDTVRVVATARCVWLEYGDSVYSQWMRVHPASSAGLFMAIKNKMDISTCSISMRTSHGEGMSVRVTVPNGPDVNLSWIEEHVYRVSDLDKWPRLFRQMTLKSSIEMYRLCYNRDTRRLMCRLGAHIAYDVDVCFHYERLHDNVVYRYVMAWTRTGVSIEIEFKQTEFECIEIQHEASAVNAFRMEVASTTVARRSQEGDTTINFEYGPALTHMLQRLLHLCCVTDEWSLHSTPR